LEGADRRAPGGDLVSGNVSAHTYHCQQLRLRWAHRKIYQNKFVSIYAVNGRLLILFSSYGREHTVNCRILWLFFTIFTIRFTNYSLTGTGHGAINGEAMAILLTDANIETLLAERKPLPPNYREKIQVKPKRGHKERELDIVGVAGSEFRLILRQSEFNVLDFSVILSYCVPQTNQRLRLRRYNGKSHQHTNTIEDKTFYDFHIHTASERYQRVGVREDWFAEPTSRYADIHSAIRCCLSDCGFDIPADEQPSLFEEEV
jgi:hypothetical protein